MAYTKLFEEIVASSVWDEDDKTRLVWITMLAIKNRDHFVRGTNRYLALAARVSQEDCDRALEKLSSPDASSRTPDNEGRRIRRENGGWTILNGEKYQQALSYEDRKAYNREKKAESRRRKKLAIEYQIRPSSSVIHDGNGSGTVPPPSFSPACGGPDSGAIPR